METTLLNDKQLSEIEGRIAVAKELLSKENTITLTKNEKEVLVAFGEILVSESLRVKATPKSKGPAKSVAESKLGGSTFKSLSPHILSLLTNSVTASTPLTLVVPIGLEKG